MTSPTPVTALRSGEAAADAEESTRVYRPGLPAAASPGAEPAPAPRERAATRQVLGQEEALSGLRQTLETAFASCQARLVAVEGEPGAGKTLFLHRASEIGVDLDPTVQIHYAALRSRDDGPYAPVSRLLLDRFGVTPASSPSAVRRDMAAAVREVLGEESETLAELLGHMAGVPFPDSTLLRELEPPALHRRTLQALARFVEGEARRRPSLWLLDDLGEADASSWDALAALLALNVPLALVVTGPPRVAQRLETADAGRCQRVGLKPLAAEDVEHLVRTLVPELEALPSELGTALLHRSRGNPRQLVELVRGLQDGGVFQSGEAGVNVDLGRIERGGLPLTMADTIRARLETLAPSELQVMHDAALVGERFWDGALLALARARHPAPAERSVLELFVPSDDDLQLQQALDALEAKGFVVRIADGAGPGLNEYTFQFAGTRSVVYADLEKSALLRGHALVARWLRLTSGLAVENPAALLAPHLERAGARKQAASAYLEAASDERSRMRTTMALVYVERALALLGEHELPERLDALHQRGSLLSALGRYPEAIAAFEEIVRRAWTLGAHARGGTALDRLGRILRERGEHEQALEHLRAALALFDAVHDLRGLAGTYDDLALTHRKRGEHEAALTAAKHAHALRVQSNDRRGQAASLNVIGRIELDLGRWDAAESRFASALKIAAGLRDPSGLAQIERNLETLARRKSAATGELRPPDRQDPVDG